MGDETRKTSHSREGSRTYCFSEIFTVCFGYASINNDNYKNLLYKPLGNV